MDQLKKQLQQLNHEDKKNIAFWLLNEVIEANGIRANITLAKEQSVANSKKRP